MSDIQAYERYLNGALSYFLDKKSQNTRKEKNALMKSILLYNLYDYISEDLCTFVFDYWFVEFSEKIRFEAVYMIRNYLEVILLQIKYLYNKNLKSVLNV